MLPRLQFIFWLGAISGVIAFFIIIVTSNLKNILSKAIISLLLLTFFDLSGICSSYNRAIIWLFAPPLIILHFFFFLSFFKNLLGLRTLFGHFFSLQSCNFFINLIVLGIKTYFQEPLSLGILLIYVGTFLNLNSGFSLISNTNKVILGDFISYINNLQFYQRPESIIKSTTELVFSESVISV